ncbi:MAG: alpha/beta hydrolase, partial [Candidatus Competibacteraceae bacterium]|nr:alpha/beta hydrolase [Candidatus Competibacteraceae bacterium]
QLFAINQQLQDWVGALKTARQLEGVDSNRIAAWGTSFGGGHALVAGVRDGQVAAIVAQCPMMDGLAAFIGAVRYAGLGAVTRMTAHALLDLTAGLFGKQGRRLPIVAEPGKLAFMSTPDALPGFTAITPNGFINEISARTALAVPLYRPVSVAAKLHCPLLMLICEQDAVAPTSAAFKVAERGGEKVEVHRFPIGHFDIYQGEHYERALALMTDFLLRSLSR